MGDAEYNLTFDVRCVVSEDSLHFFAEKFKEVILRYCDQGIRYLKRVFIIKNGAMENAINSLFVEREDNAKAYIAGPHPPNAVAVPIDEGSELQCFIFFAQSLVTGIRASNIPYDVMSSILEEIFHVQLYALTWDQFGRLAPLSDDPLEKRLIAIAARMLDEYLVVYYKALAIASMYSYAQSDGQIKPLYLLYGGDIVGLIKQARAKLEILMTEPTTPDNDKAQQELVDLIYRLIFEPLARDYAFKLVNTSNTYPESLVFEHNDFYRFQIEKHWLKISKELREMSESGMHTKEAHIMRIVEIFRDFIDDLSIYSVILA